MKIAMKFMLAFLACGVVTIGVYTRVRAQAELEDMRESVAQDHVLMARVLRPPILRLWENEGERGALERIELAKRDIQPVEIDFAWLDDPIVTTRLDDKQQHALATGKEVQRFDSPPAGSPRSYTYVPFQTPPGRVGVLVLSETLRDYERIARSALMDDVVATAAVTLLAALVALALGAWLVARPISAIIAQTRRLGGGDFSQRLTRGDDEFGILAGEINAMADDLAHAHEAERREAEAKLTALEQLRHADRLTTVGKLASGLAHELGTPLNVIAMRTKMLLANEVPEDERHKYLESIGGQTDRLVSIIRKLLDFARRRIPRRGPADLRALGRQTALLLEPISHRRNVTVTVEAGDPVQAAVDGGQIEQVLTNLVINAIHASKSGSEVRIRATTMGGLKPPAPYDGPPRDCAVLVVEDNGTGISATALGRIFEPFFSTKEPGEGTGLGLSVAYGIVEDHKGWIDVESVVGKGSTFRVCLPKEDG